MKSHARVVVIGGGAMGVGVLYQLAKAGWSDVVLVEKGELTSGSTWHAAGLVGHFIGNLNMAKIHLYGSQLYKSLEAETGQATGFHACGSLRLALTDQEVDWFHYMEGLLNYVGAEVHLLGHNEMQSLHPLLDLKGVKLGCYTPGDGHTDPASSTYAMAKGARQHGAEIYRHTLVTDVKQSRNGEWEVVTEKGTITAEHVVNATGCYGPQTCAWVGLKVPIVSMIHQYLVTENLDEFRSLDTEPPVVRDPRASCYYRQEQDGLLVGPYEMEGAEAWGLDGVDWGFDMELLPPDIDRLETSLERTVDRIPVFEKAGIKRIVSGPITHTPDGNFLLGPAPGLRNYWLACGASIGVTQGPGAGKYLAQWMMYGQTEINMLAFDPRRYGDWAVGDYCLKKSIDEYQQMYQPVLPGEYRDAGRPVKTTPIYEKLKAKGAVFAENFGWERPKWFAGNGEAEKYGYRRSNWFEAVGGECRAVAERAGLLDLSAFSKYEVSGKDAEAFLNRICANRMPMRDGGVVLAHMLGEPGGIECEATITRLASDKFYVLSGAVAELHDLDWMTQHVEEGEDVSINNVTAEYGCLVLAGPKSREILSRLTDSDLGNESFPWMRGQEIDVAGVPVRALRVSYVGELGWELHHPMAQMEKLYDALMEAGSGDGIADFGLYAVNAMRMEKGYKAWGSELTTEITPLEAGLDRFVKMDKTFIGRDAVEARKRDGIDTRLVYVSVDAEDADCVGNEAVYDGERIIGITTSGAYGYRVGKSIAFAYVEPDYARPGSSFDIAILGRRRRATVEPAPLYDPQNERLRS
ncbi:MAG TPA: FAD-dependent oxidoreductase [Gammaproteobacteria bacterium]|nr:FAD-dependent oxidoreductase [Gammaproteobacteria bacterium]